MLAYSPTTHAENAPAQSMTQTRAHTHTHVHRRARIFLHALTSTRTLITYTHATRLDISPVHGVKDVATPLPAAPRQQPVASWFYFD